MPLRYALATLVILLGQSEASIAQAHTTPMLAVHVSAPKWVDGCLDLTVERVNISQQTIYLPKWAPVHFLLSANLIHNDPAKKNEDVWLLFWGLSDIVDYSADEFPAGSKTTEHFCLPERFAVVSQQQKTRRYIEVRGHIKIVASYFPTEDDWKTNKAEHEKYMPRLWSSPSASLEISVPCPPQPECIADCDLRPPIVEGEGIAVPDIFQFHRDWNERGKALSDRLYLQYSPCRATH